MVLKYSHILLMFLSLNYYSQKDINSTLYSKSYDIFSFEANNTAVWTPNSNPFGNQNIVKIENELRFKAGVSVTIKNMTFEFGPNAKVIIEKGYQNLNSASLVLSNSVFTILPTLSNELWNGIELEGYDNIDFSSASIDIINNSVIEHAKIGVNINKLAKINVNNSSFINNHTGVAFNTNSYINNQNSFYKATFNWNDNLKKQEFSSNLIHIYINNYRGITIKNSFFLNEIKNKNSNIHFEKGIGIMGVNANFDAKPDCNELTESICPINKKNIFKNLEYAVNVQNFDGRSFRVDFSDISNCKVGIYVKYAQNERITRNKIAVREHGQNQKYGIVLENSKGFIVEENYITNFVGKQSEIPKTFGIVIRESGEEHNEIYKNSFDNLFVGSQAEGNNGYHTVTPEDHGNGFQWKCNNFIHNIYKNDLVVANGRVDYHQGTISGGTNLEIALKTARNRFSLVNEGLNLEHDIQLINSDNNMAYIHLSNPNQTPDSYTDFGTSIVSPDEQDENLYYNESYCPSNFNIPGPIGKSTMQSIGGLIENLKEKLNAGDSEELLNFVKTHNENNEVKAELEKFYPYLSDRILLAYIERNPPITDISRMLIANPNYTNTLKSKINELKFPNNEKKLLVAAQKSLTPRQELASEISYLISEYQVNENIYLSYLEDEIQNLDAFKNELFISNSLRNRKKAYEIALRENNTIKINQLSEWLSNNGVSTDYFQLAQLRKNLNQYPSYKNAFESDINLAQLISNIAKNSSDNESRIMAQSIIDLANDNLYVIPYVENGESGNIGSITFSKQEEVKINYNTNIANIYPNPSNGTFVIDLIDQPESVLEVEILDLSGKQVYYNIFENANSQKINTENLSNGIYLINIKQNDTWIETQKIVVKGNKCN